MLMIFKKNLTKKEYLKRQLEKELRRSSKGAMPKAIRVSLAARTIERLDFSNSYQMHKSIRGYADILVHNYFKDIKGE